MPLPRVCVLVWHSVKPKIAQTKQQINMCVRMLTYSAVCASLQSRLLTRLWRWRLYIEGSCPVSEGPFGYSLPRQSCGEGAHSSRTWLLGGESSSSTPDLLACRRRLSQPPSPLLRLADTLHHHPQGRPFLTLSQHLHSCLSTHTHTQNKQPFMESLKKKKTSQNWRHSLVSLETGYYRVRKKH